ncbi:MAG: hypothetical protein KG003_09455 [Bacteroidetes bacterium]|nr:hypothetical protein [Bacteroidota bacterium]
MIIQILHRRKLNRKLAALILLSMISECLFPFYSYGLTSGPSQPEYEKFQPVNANEMVDPFTGDLKYNVPLFDIGGYPVSIVYSGNIGIEEEASWTGLGWNLNVGNINRISRGIPDDFKNEEIVQKEYRKPRKIFKALFQKERDKGVGKITKKTELLPLKQSKLFNLNHINQVTETGLLGKLSWGVGLAYDNYRGVGFIGKVNYELSRQQTTEQWHRFKTANSTLAETKIKESASEEQLFKFGMDYSSLEGTKLHGSVNLSAGTKNKRGNFLFRPEFEANSVSGLTDLGIVTGVGVSYHGDNAYAGLGYNLSLLRSNPIQDFAPNYSSFSMNVDVEISKPKSLWDKRKYSILGTVNIYTLKSNVNKKNAYGYLYQNEVYKQDQRTSIITDFSREDKNFDDLTPVLPCSQWTPDVFIINGQGTGGTYIPQHKIIYPGSMPYQNNVSNAFLAQGEFGKGVDMGFEVGVSLGYNLMKEERMFWGPQNLEELGKIKNTNPDKNVHLSKNGFNSLMISMAGEHSKLLPSLEDNDHYGENHYYMKNLGGFYGNLENIPAELQRVLLVKPHLKRELLYLTVSATDEIKCKDCPIVNINSPLTSPNRIPQSGAFIMLTANQAKEYGTHKKIQNYTQTYYTGGPGYSTYIPDITTGNTMGFDEIDRIDAIKKDHHISEVRIQQQGGGQYIYGLPVYNKVQYEYRFNIGKDITARNYYNGIVNNLPQSSFIPIDFPGDKKDNGQGVDGYFFKKEIPPYATNYLLTEVLSSDYVDNDAIVGPSEGDLGGYVKFNYTYAGDKTWRTPFADKTAFFQRNNQFDNDDDIAIFNYGVKELWYLESIESKTHIALFFTEKRRDDNSPESTGEEQLNSNTQSRLLRRIEIYSLIDFRKNGTNAKPEKIIHFEYSYDLCPDVINHEPVGILNELDHPLKGMTNTLNGQSYDREEAQKHGKLTLHKIWFTYGSTQWQTGGTYLFEYDMNNNPAYKARAVDMWGTYIDPEYYKINGIADENQLNILDFPYTPQNKSDADRFASAYKLKRIHLPSGGIITIDYEADDYAYVQDQKAMKLYPIAAVGSDAEHSSRTILQDHDNLHNADGSLNPWIFVKVPNATNAEDLIPDQDIIGFSAMVNLDGKTKYQTIQGYTEYSPEMGLEDHKKDIADYSGIGIGYNVLAFRIIPVRYKRKDINPITKFAWQFMRDQAPYLLNPGSEKKNRDQGNTAENIIGSIFGFIDGASKIAQGEAEYCLNRRYGVSVDLNRSFVRLNNYSGFKYGGGYRVKQISISDTWETMASPETSASYVTEYDYTTSENGNIISSGVATMEPTMSRENPLKRPISLPTPFATRKLRKDLLKALASDLYKEYTQSPIKPSNSGFLRSNTLSYDEGPIGEAYFPVPSVGYSKVSIKNLKPSNSNITRHGTGKTILEFYTSRDFPTITSTESMETQHLRINELNPNLAFGGDQNNNQQSSSETKFNLSLDISYSNDLYGASQGFLVELNDMNGKPKSVKTYGENLENYTSATYYRYHETVDQEGRKKLSNSVTVINRDGTHEEKDLAVDVDFAMDSERIKSSNTELGCNVDYDQTTSIPVLAVTPKLNYSKRETRKLTFTKVITRHGILKEIEVIENENKITTQNLAYDSETGSVLISRVQNEFNDWIYNITKPAYWIYAGMDAAWKNIDMFVELEFASDGKARDYSDLLVSGDELIDNTTFQKYWILHDGIVTVNGSQIHQVNAIDKDGNLITGTTKTFRLIRSGHRELVSAPAEEVSLLRNPLDLANVYTAIPNVVIGAKAYEFYDKTQLYFQTHKCLWVKCSSPETNTVDISFATEPQQGFSAYCFDDLGLPDYQVGSTVNPYYIGIRGVWRPSREWNYYDRTNTNSMRNEDEEVKNNANTTNIRYDGSIKEFIPFWKYENNVWDFSNHGERWISNENITVSDNLGNVLESNNPLNVKSSALFGYNKMLATTVTANAPYNEVLFDGFEDYQENDLPWLICNNELMQVVSDPISGYDKELLSYRHWPVWRALVNKSASVTRSVSHSGWNSLKIKQGTIKIVLDENASGIQTNSFWQPYKLTQNDFIPNFMPSAKKYMISFWYKEDLSGLFQFDLLDGIGVVIPKTATSENGRTIDGWKKAEYYFTVEAGKEKLTFQFTNNAIPPNHLKLVYVDDLRVMPIDANMKNFIYDRINFRLMATLDENNYATFYEYNDDGSLVRTKVETERGIMTVSESRSNIRK